MKSLSFILFIFYGSFARAKDFIQRIQTKAEIESKNTYDKVRAIDGYKLSSEVKSFIYLGDDHGLLLGADGGREERDSQATIQRIDNISAGYFIEKQVQRVKGRTAVFLNHIPDAEKRRLDRHQGSVKLDARIRGIATSYFLMRSKIKYEEFLLSEAQTGTELRQAKIEFSPAFNSASWEAGMQNKWSQSWFLRKPESGYVENGPFIRWNGKNLETTFKVIYRTLQSERQAYTAAIRWEDLPYFSFELEASF